MKKVFYFLLIAIGAFTIASVFGDVFVSFQVGLATLAAAPIFISGSASHLALKEARDNAGRIAKQMEDLNKISVDEKREFTDEENQRWNKLDEDLSKYENEIRRLERAIDIESRMGKVHDKMIDGAGISVDELREKRNEAFRAWLRNGLGGLNTEQNNEMRALSLTDAAGGYTVPEGFMMKLEAALLAYGGLYAAAAKLPTATGNDIPYPTVNDTSNSGAIIDENTDVGASVDPTFGSVTIKAFTYSSKPVLVSNILLQDTAFDIETKLAEMLSIRIMRALATHLATGNGTTQPQGLVTAATNASLSSVAAAAITFDNLIDLFHSVDPNYRDNGSFIFNDNTLKVLRKLKDEEGLPIWQGNYAVGAPSTILGKPYVIVKEIADIGASAKSVLFGDLSKFMVREVQAAAVKRLVERYADYNQTGFLLFKRFDSRLIDAGTHPVKYLIHAAS